MWIVNRKSPFFNGDDGFSVSLFQMDGFVDDAFEAPAAPAAHAYVKWMGGFVYGNARSWLKGVRLMLIDVATVPDEFKIIKEPSALEHALTEYLRTRYEGFAAALAEVVSQSEDTLQDTSSSPHDSHCRLTQ